MPNNRDSKVILLPSDKSKADIYELYNSTATELGFRHIALSTFKKLWLEHCPTLLIIKPATDLCTKCQLYSAKLSNGGNETEEEKREDLRKYNDHISKAKLQRDHYRGNVEESKELYSALLGENKLRGLKAFLKEPSVPFKHKNIVVNMQYLQQISTLMLGSPLICQKVSRG